MTAGLLAAFVAELRAHGLAVSTAEAIEAAAALQLVDVASRTQVRTALVATLVKRRRDVATFDTVFDVFFSRAPAPASREAGTVGAAAGDHGDAGGAGSGFEAEELAAALLAAIAAGDTAALERLAALAVDRLAGFEPGRPVGGTYYLHRVQRQLEMDGLLERLMAQHPDRESPLGARLVREEYRVRLEAFIEALRAEIRRRLVIDRGALALARTLRRPPIEDIDLIHASRAELAELEAAVRPLARKLAARLARRRRHLRHGRLDVRRTLRRSLSTGGALAEPRFRSPQPAKPELLLLCDISGSVATFAHFTMQLVAALSNEFSRVRTFAFVDDVDEVTRFFSPGVDLHQAVANLAREARVVSGDGHSDYGEVLARFLSGHADAVGPRTTLMVTGDARSNYRPGGAAELRELAERARALYWLNPEPRRYWDTGDSVMSRFAPFCTGVHQVQSLRQLERFVEELALPPAAQPVKLGP